MRFRDEILRGIRMAAITLALLLVAVVIYRTVHVQISAPAPVAQQPDTAPKPVAKPAIIGGSAVPGSIPPPPPSRGNAASAPTGEAGK